MRGIGTRRGSVVGACRGAKAVRRSDGTSLILLGTQDKLAVDVGGVVSTTDVTAVGPDGYWQFHQFGTKAYAIGPNNTLQELSPLDSDLTWSAVADPPEQANVIGQAGGHMIVGRLASNPYGIQWAGLNTPSIFTPERDQSGWHRRGAT